MPHAQAVDAGGMSQGTGQPSATEVEATTRLPRRRSWDEGPLHQKISLLVLAALALGVLIGQFETKHGNQIWPLALGFCAAAWLLIVFVRCWVVAPYERLLHWLEVQARSAAPFALKNLPIDRRDEIGRIARAMHQISTMAIRNRHESRRLRRTLDSRIEVETAKATGELRHLALRDDLTELGNRRFLDEQLEVLTNIAVSSGSDLIAIMIDVDHFKQVNDSLGHAEGDRLLVLVAKLIRGSIRHHDVAVRIGGDEFAVLMPGATVKRGVQFADSVRRLFVQQLGSSKATRKLNTSLSVGVASLIHDDCADGPALLASADQYLYAAKHAGRGCTIASELD